MKNRNARFEISLGPYCRKTRAAGIPLHSRLCARAGTFVDRWAPLPLFLILALSLACPNTVSAQVSGSYRVNTKESQIEIHLFKGGFLSSLGDDHLIALTHFSGTADLSRSNPWKADLTGEAASLKVIDPWGNPDERKEVQDTMLGPQQIDAEHFPSIELHSVSFNPVDHDATWHLVANVKLHGVTRKEQFSLDCHEVGDKLQIRGKRMFKLTDFNIQPFSKALGAVKVKNDFEVTYNIVLDRIH